MHEVFGAQLGEAFNFLKRETSTFIGFFANFDRILLSETSTWFQGRDRNDILRAAITRGLTGPVRKWGTQQKFKLSHMLFGGKLPSFLGFDRGPITLPGGRATIHQNQIYRSGGRVTSFAPSFRMVVDMSEPGTRTNLAGGPSDRRFSRWYCSDLKNWRLGRYKKLGM
jgi:penicillin amidase